jgi:predicted glycosyl hydrolase (DUF1957 family)
MRGRRWRSETIRTITIAGETYTIDVNSDGEFSTHVGGEYIKSDKLAAVLARMKKAARAARVEVAIPIMLLGHRRFSGTKWHRERVKGDAFRATVYGINRKRDEFMIRYDDAAKDTISETLGRRWSGGDSFIAKPAKNPADEATMIAEYHRLVKAKDDAIAAFEKFRDKHRFEDIRKVVEQAQREAVDDPKEPAVEESEDPR